MGSDSDWPVMEAAAQALAEFDVPFEVGVVSRIAPRPDARLRATAAGRGIEVIIAGAGGAAHLPGMVASATPLPVIGVPVPLAKLDGLDSLLSIVQMPAGVPVATVSIGGARNAGRDPRALAIACMRGEESTKKPLSREALRPDLIDFRKSCARINPARADSVAVHVIREVAGPPFHQSVNSLRE